MKLNTLRYAVLATALTAAPALADRGNISYDYATVIESQPIIRIVKVSTPREECWEETVAYRDRDRGYHDDYRRRDHGLGTVLGGVVGGAIGNAVGHSKKNKQVGAVVGAVVGATIGNAMTQTARAENRRRHDDYQVTSYGTEEICEIVHDYHEEERIIGYDVRYRYNDETYATRMDEDPGDTIKVRLALSPVVN